MPNRSRAPRLCIIQRRFGGLHRVTRTDARSGERDDRTCPGLKKQRGRSPQKGMLPGCSWCPLTSRGPSSRHPLGAAPKAAGKPRGAGGAGRSRSANRANEGNSLSHHTRWPPIRQRFFHPLGCNSHLCCCAVVRALTGLHKWAYHRRHCREE
jgi:hypothetical protein